MSVAPFNGFEATQYECCREALSGFPNALVRLVVGFLKCAECADATASIRARLAISPRWDWNYGSETSMRIHYRPELDWVRVLIVNDLQDSSNGPVDDTDTIGSTMPLWALCGVLVHEIDLFSNLRLDWFDLDRLQQPDVHAMHGGDALWKPPSVGGDDSEKDVEEDGGCGVPNRVWAERKMNDDLRCALLPHAAARGPPAVPATAPS